MASNRDVGLLIYNPTDCNMKWIYRVANWKLYLQYRIIIYIHVTAFKGSPTWLYYYFLLLLLNSIKKYAFVLLYVGFNIIKQHLLLDNVVSCSIIIVLQLLILDFGPICSFSLSRCTWNLLLFILLNFLNIRCEPN